MPTNPLNKVIDLIKKTGDNCIVVDSTGNPIYVVMDFGKYQQMYQGNHQHNKADEPKLDVLEDAIKEAKNAPEMVEIDQESDPFIKKNSLNEDKNTVDSGKTEEKYYFEPID